MPKIEPSTFFPFSSPCSKEINHMPQKNDYSHTQRSKIGLSQISNVYDVTILWLETIIECITKILKSNFKATNKFRIHEEKK